jgi:hypothetical protein
MNGAPGHDPSARIGAADMDDILAIAGIAATAAIVAAMAIGLRWFLGDQSDSWTFADMMRASATHGWPVGVQEEEPFRWRVEALSRARRTPAGEAGRASRHAPAPNRPRTAVG